ncbi:hypothetical protein ACRALDRAFT_209765 [Sodiomyces alcalophilus JCM 7366]|uniref:uncharacterized protein n=1 Tax=Sodiomyces alcalophilus JCM 7366 TaxID=591952 RepID=UPI0039B42748
MRQTLTKMLTTKTTFVWDEVKALKYHCPGRTHMRLMCGVHASGKEVASQNEEPSPSVHKTNTAWYL